MEGVSGMIQRVCLQLAPLAVRETPEDGLRRSDLPTSGRESVVPRTTRRPLSPSPRPVSENSEQAQAPQASALSLRKEGLCLVLRAPASVLFLGSTSLDWTESPAIPTPPSISVQEELGGLRDDSRSGECLDSADDRVEHPTRAEEVQGGA